jgi:predicted lipoprotein
MLARRRALVVLALAGCGGGGKAASDADIGGFDRRALLEHLGGTVVAPIYAAFAGRADALVVAVDAHCAAADIGPAAAERATAQDAWRDAIDVWEDAEAVLVGPAAMDEGALRSRIYAWPLAATCGVDQDVVERWADPDGYDVAAQLDNVRSLAAIEYLLFVDAAAHTCAITPAGWDALGDDLPRARCALAAAIARDVAVQAETLRAAWSPDEGAYASTLAAGDQREAVNQVSDAFFYVDRMVKDMKLAEAAGIAINACGTSGEVCEREIEHRHADHGSFALRRNLVALRAAFSGTTAIGEGLGFDDYLAAVDAGEVGERMLGALDRAIAAADALPDSYLAALTDQRDEVVALHAEVKAFTDDLKSQFLTVLGLDIPDDVAGDND